MNRPAASLDPRDDVLGRSRVIDNPALEAFYAELPTHNAAAFWKRANAIEPWEPESRHAPTHWRYRQMRDLCLRAIDLVRPEDAGRRVVVLLNNSDAGRENSAVCGWLFSGLQAMKPGEITPAHKHTASAHRFIMEGAGAYTVVDGHEISLGANDYVLTPGGCWHDHGVVADGKTCIWQDGLDIPLMNALETNFYAVYPELTQTPAYPRNDLPMSYGNVAMRLEGAARWDKPYSPVMVYRWEATRDAIWNLAKVDDGSPFDGQIMRYSNPLTGGWALQTMGANMQMLKAGLHTRAHRHTGNVIYNVAQGEGHSIIGGERIDWMHHDIFCVPAWTWHEHVNTGGEEAFLFSFNDFPVMDALGVRIEEALEDNGGHQQPVG